MEAAVQQLNLKEIDKSEWKVYRFDEIAKKISENVDPTQTDLEVYYGLEHLDSEDIHIKRHGYRTDVKGTKLRCYKGDIIFGRRRAYQRKAAVVEKEGFCSAHALVLRAIPEVIDPKLFPFFLHSDVFMHRAVDISVGSLSPTINWGTLKSQEFLLPPKEQQAELAELLWAMDEVIEREREVLDSIEDMLHSLSKKYFKEQVRSHVELGDAAKIIMGQSPEGKSYNENGEGTPLINGPTEFTDRYPVKIQWTTQPTKLCQDRDILLCVRGSTTGRMNISNDVYCIGRGIAAIRGARHYKTEFLEYALRFNVFEIMRLATGSTFPNIDSKTLRSIKLPKVEPSEQDSIIEKLISVDSIKEELTNATKASKALQKSLINQIF